MPPPPPPFFGPGGPCRIATYYQTQDLKDGAHVSLLPLLGSAITHVYVAAIHINDPPGNITLNDDPPDSPKYAKCWKEVAALQGSGIKVLGMLGGAAHGSFKRLDGDDEKFESYYACLKDMIKDFSLDGLDLDVEEAMSLDGIIRLIDRLKLDFGDHFLVTLAPVKPALTGGKNLSGFDYHKLEKSRGSKIAWYNAQFYCGWGNMATADDYEQIMKAGWPPEKVVAGLLTNPANCSSGYVEMTTVMAVIAELVRKYPEFGGVVGWEYFNSMPGGEKLPWEWVQSMKIAVEMGAHC